MRKQIRCSAIALACAFGAAAAQAEIVIGVSLGTTGPGASLGIPYKNAFQLVPKTLGGEAVRYVILDDESKPDNAAKNARKFVAEDKVDAIMGSNGVPSAIAMAQVAGETKTPMIALTPMPQLPPERHAWTFVIPRNVRLAEAPSYGQPGVVFDPSSKGAQAFVAFAHELVRRVASM